MTVKVTVVDYGRGNLFSVRRAFEHCGAEVELTGCPDEIRNADRLVLPGVGAFGDAANELRQFGLDGALVEFAATGRPMLGICIGMQLLFDCGEEFGEHRGLGLVAGRVRAIPDTSVNGIRQKIPHIGWRELYPPAGDGQWSGTILDGIEKPVFCYFAHSFAGYPEDEGARLAECHFGGHGILAAVRRENVWGCQFHPEKSGEIGLRIVRNFLSL